MVRLRFTNHAVEQYRARWLSPRTPAPDAERILELLVSQAAPIKERTVRGDEMWRAGEVRFVVKRDGDGLPPVIVTVLPRVGRDDDVELEEVVDAAADTARSEALQGQIALREAEEAFAAASKRQSEAAKATNDAHKHLENVRRRYGVRKAESA